MPVLFERRHGKILFARRERFPFGKGRRRSRFPLLSILFYHALRKQGARGSRRDPSRQRGRRVYRKRQRICGIRVAGENFRGYARGRIYRHARSVRRGGAPDQDRQSISARVGFRPIGRHRLPHGNVDRQKHFDGARLQDALRLSFGKPRQRLRSSLRARRSARGRISRRSARQRFQYFRIQVQ